MLVLVGEVRLFVDIDGAKLVPDENTMRERPAPHLKTVRVPGAGRLLPIEQPDAVLALVRDFRPPEARPLSYIPR